MYSGTNWAQTQRKEGTCFVRLYQLYVNTNIKRRRLTFELSKSYQFISIWILNSNQFKIDWFSYAEAANQSKPESVVKKEL